MILLTFNILNNRPETTSGQFLSEEDLRAITLENTAAILRSLENYDIKCTFFIELNLIEALPTLLKKIVSQGHEIALYNAGSDEEAVAEAKEMAERIVEKSIRGIRRKNVRLSLQQLKAAGFIYVSDIENANILFPLKRLERSTEITDNDGISIIPESISPYSQIPYNDFIFQVTPMEYYKSMVSESLKNDEFVMIYLNTWQLTDIKKYRLKIPFYRRYNAGRNMEDKMKELLEWINKNDYATSRIKDYIF